jgi:hypothetical protein
MRTLLAAMIAAGLCSASHAAEAKFNLIESCDWAIMTATNFAPKSAPLHAAEVRYCLRAVADYVRQHCPIAAADQNALYDKVRAVSESDAPTAEVAIAAACH